MAIRIRTIVIGVTSLLIGVPVLVFLLLPARPDARGRDKIAEVFAHVITLRTALAEICDLGGGFGGVPLRALGLPDPYKSGPLVQYITVRAESPERVLVSALLNDVYSDILFWRKLSIPKGAKIVWEGECTEKVFRWSIRETTVPARYLPREYRKSTRAN